MGGMILNSKMAHLALLDQYEIERRGRIDEYMASTWIPRFIKTLAKDGNLWGKTCAIKNTTDAALELQGFVEASARQIAKKRKELTDALDLTMVDLRAAVNIHYALLEQSNNAVTANLRSVRKNDEVMESLLKKNGVSPENLTPLREASAKLDKMLN
jgi:pyruvate-formate lyase-activating enzyme